MRHHFLRQYGTKMVESGWPLVPIKEGTKYPGIPGWQQLKATQADVDRWLDSCHAHCGIGILTAHLPVIDVDIKNIDIAKAALVKITELMGELPDFIKVGRKPKFSIMTRLGVGAAPFKKQKSAIYLDADGAEMAIEILADGQQTVCYAVHPDTNEPYCWVGGLELADSVPDDLPEYDQDVVDQLMTWFDQTCDMLGYEKKTGVSEAPAEHKDTTLGGVGFVQQGGLDRYKGPVGLTAHQVSALLPDSCDDYDVWFKGLCAVHHESEGGEWGRQIAAEWSQSSGKYDDDVFATKWDSIKDDMGKRHVVTMRAYMTKEMERDRPIVAEVKAELRSQFKEEKEVKSTFHLTPASRLLSDHQPACWSIRGYLPETGLVFLIGAPASGKSLLAIDWGCHIATGSEWRGGKVEIGAVAYLAGEGHWGISRRLKAWSMQNDCDLESAPISVSDAGVDLIAHQNEVIAALDEMQATHGSLRIVVIDTLHRHLSGDENSAADMGTFIAVLDKIRSRYDCLVLVVHHSGHNDDKRGRGSSAIRASADAEYIVEPKAVGTHLVKCTKMKDGEQPEPFGSKFIEIELPWLDEDGFNETSVALEETDHKTLKEKKLSPNVQLGIETLAEACVANGTQAVHLEQWRTFFYEKSTAENQGTKRTNFSRARKDMVKEEMATVKDDIYTLNNEDALENARRKFGLIFPHQVCEGFKSVEDRTEATVTCVTLT